MVNQEGLQRVLASLILVYKYHKIQSYNNTVESFDQLEPLVAEI